MKLTSNKTVYGIKAFGNPTLNSDNTFIKEYGESIIRSNKSITVFLENTRNTNVVGLSGGSDHKTIGDYARGILTKNTENTNIFYLTLCLSALTDTNPNLIAIEQINSQNTNITAMTMKEDSTYNNKGNFLKLVNTTNTYIGSAQDVSKTNININDIAIIMENSNNNIIENISITTQTDYVINLTNSNNNKITNNYLNGNNFRGGDSTVIQTNSKNNTLSNNIPEIIILTDDNYNDYFVNQIFNINKTVENIQDNKLTIVTNDFQREIPLLTRKSMNNLTLSVIINRKPLVNATEELITDINYKLKEKEVFYEKNMGCIISCNVTDIKTSKTNPFQLEVSYKIDSKFREDSNISQGKKIYVELVDDEYPVYDPFAILKADTTLSNDIVYYNQITQLENSGV